MLMCANNKEMMNESWGSALWSFSYSANKLYCLEKLSIIPELQSALVFIYTDDTY